MRAIKMWWFRNFRIISQKKAKKLNLLFWRNIYGDEINLLNCRSIYIDKKGRRYRIEELHGLDHFS